jgi:hypothetical protein
MTLCLDVSNFDQATFDAKCLKAAGVESIILGCQDPVAAEAMAFEAKRAGILIRASYGFDYFTAGPALGNGDIHDAIDISKHYELPRIYVDCEIDNTPDDVADRNSEVADCESLIVSAGLEAGIYTAPWWWVPNHGNTAEFAHLPLWLAKYGPNDGSIGPIEQLGFLSFGGWTRCVMHQYTSTLEVCGRGRDANYVFEEGSMGCTDDELKMLQACYRALTGGIDEKGNDRIAAWNKGGNSLLLGYLGKDDEGEELPASLGGRVTQLEAALTKVATLEAQLAALKPGGGSGDELADGDLVRLSRVKE